MFIPFKKILNIFSGPERKQIILLMLAILSTAFFEALGVVSVLPFISLVMNSELINTNIWLHAIFQLMHFHKVDSFIIFFGFVMLITILIGNALSAFATWFKLRFVWLNNHNLSRQLLMKYLRQPYTYFLNQNSAELSKNILQETNLLTNGFVMPVANFLTKTLVVLLIVVLLFIVSPLITVLAMTLLGGSYAIIYYSFRAKLRKSGQNRVEANRERFRALSEALGGIKAIKIMHCEEHFLERFSYYSKYQADLLAWNSVISLVPRYALETIAFGGVIVLVLVLLYTMGTVNKVIPLVSFFALAGYRLMPALQEIFQALTQIRFNEAIFNKVYDDLFDSSDSNVLMPLISNNSIEPMPFRESLTLRDISFKYPLSDNEVLQDLQIDVAYKSSIGIVGATGAGKTTLVDIILGLLSPQKGQMLVDGIVVDEKNTRNWQANIGYVPQNIYLCDDTITRNIAFGIPDSEINMEMVIWAAKIAMIHDFIADDLPQGYQTNVGERGVRLSGGQQQRIGIARAIYHDPELLVLDEATSSLDGLTENEFINALESAAAVKTMIVIAHRLNTVRNCDTIILIENARIVAKGTYDQLLASNHHFRAMASGNYPPSD